MTAFLMIFRRFPTTFRRFHEDFPKLFRRPDERSRTFSENFRKFLKISKDFRILPKIFREDPKMFLWCSNEFWDVRAHCYCASLLRTLFIKHARATSFSSARTESKTQQNIELMTLALTWCANIFVGCSVNPTFFRQITCFSDSFHCTKTQKKTARGKF